MVSAGHVGGTRDSGIVSIAADVLGMSVVRWMRGVGGVCYCCLPRPGPSSSQSRFPLSRWLNARIDLPGFRHRSSGDKSVGCVVQANRCRTSCGEAPQSVQMLFGSPNTLCL